MGIFEKTLHEELTRFHQINKYTKKLMEQGESPLPEPTGDVPPADDMPPADLPPADAGAEPTPTDVAAPTDLPPMDNMSEPMGDSTEEIDITDLVNMTKSIKKDLEDSKTDNSNTEQKMDTLFDKLNDLESKLSQMDTIITKIDSMGSRIENMREKTPQEKLELRSLDSYPFNQNPQQFFANKQDEMRTSGKNEYVLTKQDIDDYSDDVIRNSFNTEEEDDEYQF